jgi:GT2 family glycosyltransferase
MTVFQFKESLDLTIIIVSFNTKDILLDCLASVYAKTEGITFEIIVVDNDSNDDTSDSVLEQFPDVRLIQNELNRGFSAANNQGIREAKGRNIALLNPDTQLIENSFDKVSRYFQEHSEVYILGPGIVDASGEQSPTRLWEDTPQDAALKILGLYDPSMELQKMGAKVAKEAQVISGCCFVIRRELFEEIGLLDENYFLYNEEDDFCRRARKAGRKIFFFPETSVQHLLGKSTHQEGHREKVITEAYRSNLYFYSKYYSCFWNCALRLLYKLTFFMGLIRSMFRHLTGSATADDSLSLKTKLLLMSSKRSGG